MTAAASHGSGQSRERLRSSSARPRTIATPKPAKVASSVTSNARASVGRMLNAYDQSHTSAPPREGALESAGAGGDHERHRQVHPEHEREDLVRLARGGAKQV